MTHPLSYADISIFLLEITKVCYIKKYKYRLHFDLYFLILLTFESLKIFEMNMVVVLIMLAKVAALGL